MLLRRDESGAPFRARWAALVAVASGLTGLLAFPRFGLWPLAVVSVAGLSLAVHGRRCRTAAWLGLLYGAAFFVPLLSWTGTYVGPAPWLILAAAEAGYYAGAGALLTLVQRLRAAPLWIGAVWVLTEAVRDRGPFGGFPWGRLAFSQAESPLRWFAALGGAPLVTFAVATAGGGLALGILALRPDRRTFRAVVAGVAFLLAVPLLGAVLAWPLRPPPDSSGRTATIALVQGNVPDAGLEFDARRRQVLDNHVTQTLALAQRMKSGAVARPDLVFWPENSSDIDPYRNPDAADQINKAVDAIGVPILVGAIVEAVNGARGQRTYVFRGTDPSGAPLRQLATVTLRLEPYGAQSEPHQTQFNVRGGKKVAIGRKALNFSFDVLNVTNTSAITAVTYVSGPSFGRVTDILPPRTFRAGVTFDF